jgi:hypothetical protein
VRKRGRNLAARVRERQRQERRRFGNALEGLIKAMREAGHAVSQFAVTVGSVEERVRGLHRELRGRRRA